MNLKERELLTDEELDTVVGGKTYEYEFVEDTENGDFYRCNIYDNDNSTTICIPANEWDKWVNSSTQTGDIFIRVGKK